MTELNEAKSSECIVLSIETGRLAANRLGLNLKVVAFPSLLPKPLESNPSNKWNDNIYPVFKSWKWNPRAIPLSTIESLRDSFDQ